MKIIIDRYLYGSKSTIGRVSVEVNDVMISDLFDSLEPTVREKKIPGKTAIPAGTYEVQMRYSISRKEYMPFLIGVPNFQGVMFHTGNDHTDTKGCILIGKYAGVDCLVESRKNFNILYNTIKTAIKAGDTVTVTINNKKNEL